MSKKCPNQTMPINVPRGINIQTKCKEKCALTYYYGHSKCTVTNKKDNIGSYLEINCVLLLYAFFVYSFLVY